MAPRRRSRRWTIRFAFLAGLVGAFSLFRNWQISRYAAEHPELFE